MKPAPVPQVIHAAMTAAEAPREMEREDRRIIFAKLDEVYIDAGKGYSGSWSDTKIATDLGIPRAWVTNVREEMFGPVKTNEDLAAAMGELDQLRAELGRHEKSLDALGEETTRRIADMREKIRDVGAKIDRQTKKLEQAA